MIENRTHDRIPVGHDGRIMDGEFTLVSQATGDHRTFRIETQSEKAKFAPGEKVLSLRSGSDRWTGFAFVKRDRIIVWRKHRNMAGDSLYEQYANLIFRLSRGVGQHLATVMFACNHTREESWELLDAYGIFVARVCGRCEKEVRAQYRLDIFDGPYDADEPIEPEDGYYY